MSMNKVIILGRLGQDVELKHTPNGTAVANMSIATSESWNDKSSGQKMEKTEWHRVVAWGKLAELAGQYLSKGRQCLVEGKLETRSWEDKDGNKRYTTEIRATSIQFLGANDGESKPASGEQTKPAADYDVKTDANFAADDIPF